MKRIKSRNALKRMLVFLSLLTSVFFYACQEDNPADDGGINSDIPADPEGSAPVPTLNNVRPAPTFAKTAGNASRIQAAQGQNAGVQGENGIVAIRFADSLFAWRQGTQRVYINFTDEPTQPGGRVWYSTDGFLASWSNQRGTIHTIWSGGDTTNFGTEIPLSSEKPWRLSFGTGGTLKVIRPDARDLDLTNLPVTIALQNSWLVEFLSANPNVAHNLKITVKTSTADGETRYENVTY